MMPKQYTIREYTGEGGSWQWDECFTLEGALEECVKLRKDGIRADIVHWKDELWWKVDF